MNEIHRSTDLQSINDIASGEHRVTELIDVGVESLAQLNDRQLQQNSYDQ